jgi:SAM-dependent methyltransferase
MNTKTFFNTLGNYRLKQVYLYLVQSEFAGVLTCLAEKATKEEVCRSMNWDKPYGGRFLDLLLRIGLVKIQNGIFIPEDDLLCYFSRSSKYYQGDNIKFEHYLEQTWDTLEKTLTAGERIFNTDQKSPEQYQNELSLFIRAMDNVATVRANEMLKEFDFQDSGRFLDLAAGSGAFIHEFLDKHPKWEATYFDLPEVVNLSQKIVCEKIGNGFYSPDMQTKITYIPGNFLEADLPENIRFDCILLSNVIHCYQPDVVEELFRKCKPILKKTGSIIIHDFFKDDEIGAVYDIHMMLNTYSGKAYYKKDIVNSMQRTGMKLFTVKELPSQSTCMKFELNK